MRMSTGTGCPSTPDASASSPTTTCTDDHSTFGMAKSSRRNRPSLLVFERRNYLFLLLGVLLIVAGFVAMYLEGAFLGFISLNVSPIVILVGYAVMIYAILWRPDDEPEAKDEPA